MLTSVAVPPARADVLSTSACDGAALTQPFLPWADPNLYKLAPGGDFEHSLAGWTVSDGVSTIADSEPYGVTGSVGSSSLSLAAGAVATSPPTCVNAAYPTFRFFARTAGATATVRVDVLYPGLLGGTASAPVGTVALSGAWQLTAPMVTGSAVFAATSGGTANVRLRFTELSGSARVDDIFVDPRMT
jgi:hypothetical protein